MSCTNLYLHAYTINRTNSNVWINFKTLKTNCIELDTASGVCDKNQIDCIYLKSVFKCFEISVITITSFGAQTMKTGVNISL